MPVGKTGVGLNDFDKIDWDSLTFTNNYVFLEVMSNKKRCQYLIEKVLHIPIKKILQIVAERHTSSPRISSKSIRLDVYVETLRFYGMLTAAWRKMNLHVRLTRKPNG